MVTVLGRGSFGEAVLVRDECAGGTLAVVKRFRGSSEKVGTVWCGPSESDIWAAAREAQIMASLNDDGIVRFMDLWYDELVKDICLLMEFCPGGNLSEYLVQHAFLSEESLLQLFLQCLLALAHMHTKGVLHCDLKPDNILLGRADGSVPKLKLADFGLGLLCKEPSSHEPRHAGTPLFMSPETAAHGVNNFGSDVWSLGVVFYMMMSRRPPFFAKGDEALLHSITNCEPPHPSVLSNKRYSRELGDLVMSMLRKPFEERPPARQLIASPLFTQLVLQCPWRSRSLCNVLCLFPCYTDCTLNVFTAPRLNAEIVGKLYFGDHVFVTCEVIAPTSIGECNNSMTSSSNTSESLPDITTWYFVIQPFKGFCIKDFRGRDLLRRVTDCTPCGLMPITREFSDQHAPLQEQTPPTPITFDVFSPQTPTTPDISSPQTPITPEVFWSPRPLILDVFSPQTPTTPDVNLPRTVCLPVEKTPTSLSWSSVSLHHTQNG